MKILSYISVVLKQKFTYSFILAILTSASSQQNIEYSFFTYVYNMYS